MFLDTSQSTAAYRYETAVINQLGINHRFSRDTTQTEYRRFIPHWDNKQWSYKN